jgi:hypothetical protein
MSRWERDELRREEFEYDNPRCRAHGVHGCELCEEYYAAQRTYRCPTMPDNNGVEGCGDEFDATPDADGYVECPHCGLTFDPNDCEDE